MSSGPNNNPPSPKTKLPPHVQPKQPNPPKKSYPKKTGKRATVATKNLNKAIAEINDQLATGYTPVLDPGARKYSEVLFDQSQEVAMSYDNSAPCPDANCKSKDCRTHFADLCPTPLSASNSSAVTVPETKAEVVVPPSTEAKQEAKPSNGPIKVFSRRVPHQLPYWPFFFLFMFLFALPTLYAYTTLYGGRTVPETLYVRTCESVDIVIPSTWSDLVSFFSVLPSYFNSLWCSFWVEFDFFFSMMANRWINFQYWFVGEPRPIPHTASTGTFKFSALTIGFIAPIWLLMFLASLTRRSFFKIKFRPTAIPLAFVLLAWIVYSAQPHSASSWIRSTRIDYDYCPSCTAKLSLDSPPPFMAWRWHFNISLLFHNSLTLFFLFSLYAFGPDYRIHYSVDLEDWDRLFPSDWATKFDHNSRGDKTHTRAADYLTVTTRRSIWYHIIRKPWYDKCPTSARDIKLCSWELLRQCLNPSSLSPLIDDKTAIDRIARSAANNQTVNISKHTLTQGHDVYGNTVAVAVAIRSALFDRARACEDFDDLRPP